MAAHTTGVKTDFIHPLCSLPAEVGHNRSALLFVCLVWEDSAADNNSGLAAANPTLFKNCFFSAYPTYSDPADTNNG